MRITLLCAFVVCAGFGHATILTFDDTTAGNGTVWSQAYGDNVTAAVMGNFQYDISNGATPDVTVEYMDGTTTLSAWTTGYADLVNVVYYEPDGANGYSITLTGSNNQAVALHGFDMGNWGTTVILPGVSVEDGRGNVLFSDSNVALQASGGPHTSYDFAQALVGTQLVIKVDTTGLGSNSDNIGIDNVSFTQQPVPEPATMALLGFGALAALKRRKKA